MKATIFLLLFQIITSNLFGQYWSKNYDLFDGNEYGTAIIKTGDGVVVSPRALCNNNSEFCLGVMKFDFDGNLLWKYVESDSMNSGYPESIAIDDDTIYIHSEYAGAVAAYKDMAITQLSQDGQFIRKVDYYDTGYNGGAKGLSITEDRIYAQSRNYDTLVNQWRIHLRAFDRQFNKLWDLDLPRQYKVGSVADFQVTADGGFVIAMTGHNHDRIHMAIEKYDKYGNLQWATEHPKSYYDSSSTPIRLSSHPDGGFLGVWRTDTFGYADTMPPWQNFLYGEPPLVFKTDSVGNFLWEKLYLTINKHDYYNLFAAKNGDIMICGRDLSHLALTDPKEPTGYIKRLDKNGVFKWQRRIRDEREGGNDFWFFDGVELDNGDFIFTGEHERYVDPNNPEPPFNVWLVRVNSEGCFNPNCETNQFLVSSPIPENENDGKIFMAFPTPFSDHFSVASILGKEIPKGDYQIKVFDFQGKEILTENLRPHFVNGFQAKYFSPGNYAIVIFHNGQVIQTIKTSKF